jgi:septal ring factor EnvC (AmiA/AmiB activator)
MFVDLPQQLILFAAGAFVLGWLLSTIVNSVRARRRTTKRDPRDVRIRALEAELRIAQGDSGKTQTKLKRLEEELKETTVGLERRDHVITEQQSKIEKIQADRSQDPGSRNRAFSSPGVNRHDCHGDTRLSSLCGPG